MQRLTAHLKESWGNLADVRKPNNNRKYDIGDAALCSFAMFYFQDPSFAEFQRQMDAEQGTSNARTMFGIERIPSSPQIRNLLDGQVPSVMWENFDWLHDELKASGTYDSYRDVNGTFLIALDGVNYFSSAAIECSHCLKQTHANGTVTHSHSAIIPVMVKPGRSEVIAFPPEFISNQDGQKKQDCELNASKRWLGKHSARFEPKTVTFLGDDLYSHQPFCAWIGSTMNQYFMCVAKPESHVWLFESIDSLQKIGGVQTHHEVIWSGKKREVWTYRWIIGAGLTGDPAALMVNWLEVIVTDKVTGKRLYFNTWITNHAINAQVVHSLAKAGRARWKVENESHNILKEHGYHLEHNFGHGKLNLSAVLLCLNLLTFLTHTVQQLAEPIYKAIRAKVVTRRSMFELLRVLVALQPFESWTAFWTRICLAKGVALPSGP